MILLLSRNCESGFFEALAVSGWGENGELGERVGRKQT